MLKALSASFLQVLVVFSALSAVTIETYHFADIKDHIKPNTLVLLDIDDTLLIPVQALGTDVWFIHRFKSYLQQYDFSDAKEMALADWEGIRHLTKVKIEEQGSENVIKELQDQNITVMGLTTQGLALATRTVRQLNSLDIDLTKTAPSHEDHFFMNQHGILYRDGVLFTSGTPKGPALLTLLDIIDLHPDHVIFINDKATHLRDVEESVESRNIAYTGLRYSHSDERVASFDPAIADIQWKYSSFERILTDDEAKAILNRQ